MHSLKERASKMYATLVSHKTISRPSITEDGFNEFLGMVDTINGLSWDVSVIGGRNIADIQIPTVLAGLFIPAKVVVSTSEHKAFLDLENKANAESCDVSYATLDDHMTEILNMKKATCGTVSLAEIRKVVGISDVAHLLSDDKHAHENLDGKEMPIHVSFNLTKASYLNADIDDAILDTWRNIVKAI